MRQITPYFTMIGLLLVSAFTVSAQEVTYTITKVHSDTYHPPVDNPLLLAALALLRPWTPHTGKTI